MKLFLVEMLKLKKTLRKRYYNSSGGLYKDRWLRFTRGRDLWDEILKIRISNLLGLINIKQDEKLLEAGCGDGLISMLSALKGADVVSLDLSEKSLRMFKGRAKDSDLLINLILSDINVLPFPEENFDIIICSEVLEHLENYENTLNELYRVLKPQGRAIFSVPNAFYCLTITQYGKESGFLRTQGNVSKGSIFFLIKKGPKLLLNAIKRGFINLTWQGLPHKHYTPKRIVTILKKAKFRNFKVSASLWLPFIPFQRLNFLKELFLSLNKILSNSFPFKYLGANFIILCKKQTD